MKAISLFTNCGAGDVGYAAAGFQFKVISEIVKRRITVASLNLPDAIAVLGDLRSTWPCVVDAFREFEGSESPVLLSGCPPCQGMSSARSDRGKEADPDAGTRDGRNLLALPIAHIALELKPIFIVVENVPAFFRRKVHDPLTHDPVSAAELLSDRLKEEYHRYALLVNLSEYGVPQNRSRAFLTFVKRNTAALDSLQREEKAPFPLPTHGGHGLPDEVTLDQALAELDLPPLDPRSTESAQCDHQPMHRVPRLDAERYEMIASIPPGSGASAWDSNLCHQCGPVDVGPDAATCSLCDGPLLRPVLQEPDGSWRLI